MCWRAKHSDLEPQFVLLTKHQHKNPPVGSGAARLTPFSARLHKLAREVIPTAKKTQQNALANSKKSQSKEIA